MPWKISDTDALKKGMNSKEKRMWVSVANSALKACTAKGGADCEKHAIRIASAAVNKARKSPPSEDENVKSKETAEDVEDLDTPITESGDESCIHTYGAISFDELNAAESANESLRKVSKYTSQFPRLVENIMYSQDVDDKFTAIKTLTEEYMSLVQEVIGIIDHTEEPTAEEPPIVTEVAVQESETQLTETFDGIGADILEEAGLIGDILNMRVQIIKPGWGNSKDNHYYPIEVLARDSGVFKGIKMYETDHRESEKSTRTWVSTITDIDGFTETGAPIARVAVHDPQFAQRIRNLKAANLLDKMDCSILATGKVKSGEVDGKKGNIVEAITSANSVDWVTKAGAGGHALDLVETVTGSEGVTTMTVPVTEGVTQLVTNVTNVTNTVVQPVTNTVIPVVTNVVEGAPEPVVIAPTAEAIIEVIKEVMLEEKQVPQDRVDEILAASRLPERARDHLCNRVYNNEVSLTEAIAEELTYLQEITKAGKPFGTGGQSLQERAASVTVEEADKKLSSVVNKYL